MQLTLKQICDALRISRPRIEQWISRGYFRPPQEPILGMARDWEVVDAIRLALMAEMLDAGMTAQQAGALVYVEPHSFKDDCAFFVAWQGYHATAIRPTGPNGEPLKVYSPGQWYGEIIQKRKLVDFIGSDDITIALVVNLDNLERRVKEKLDSKD